MSLVLSTKSLDQFNTKQSHRVLERLRLEGTSAVNGKEEMHWNTPARFPLPFFYCMISKVQCFQTGMNVFNVRA